MCLVLPSRVVSVDGQQAEVELPGGMRAVVGLALHPDVAVGQYVMVDRGHVLEVIEPAEAEAILAMYQQIGDLLAEADGLSLAAMESVP